jgi:serine phosphatase RsbU (regulator of sigma subunit)
MSEPAGWRVPQASGVDFAELFTAIPTPYLVMTPDLVIVEANEAYLANVGRTREELLGRPVFEAFPPTADALDDDGRPRIQVSFERARDTGLPDTMPLQKYDIPDGSGGYVERYWSLISVPILDPDGRTALVVQRAEDITDFVAERKRGHAERERGRAWRRRVQEVESDLYARSQELAAAVRAKEEAGRRLASLAQVAWELATAETVDDLTAVVFSQGLPVLEASGGSIAVRTADSDLLEVTRTGALGRHTPGSRTLPLAAPLPAAIAARGTQVLVPDEQSAAAFPGLREELLATGTRAWASLPLRIGDRLLGSLSVGWAAPRAFLAEEVELLGAFAAQCAQALDRLQVLEAERKAAAELQRISETLQRSLLTAPPVSDRLHIAVSYRPASHVAQVGGDWHDAFVTADGWTSLVIGDVAGHDKDAAAAMAQVRNLLRGVAQTLNAAPAAVLAALDRAMDRLDLGVLATVVLAQVSEPDDEGRRVVRWCNAGHPPPLLVRADGSAELLSRTPDLLTGLLPDAERADHELVLELGDTLLLFTDGLVETRGGDIEDDLESLRRRVGGRPVAADPEQLLAQLADDTPELSDDVALLAARLL